MIPQNIENIIVKYFTHEVNSSELDVLGLWLGKPANEKLFENYVQLHFEVRLAMSKLDIDAVKKILFEQIKKDKSPFYKYKIGRLLKYSSVAFVVIGIYLYQQKETPTDVTVKQDTTEAILVSKDEDIVLILGDGSQRSIKPDKRGEIRDADGKVIGSHQKNRLQYEKTLLKNELLYNILNVPNGKRFDVVLSDGTHVHLNSGTTLKYPVKFVKGSSREVFLSGEAYFDVAEDKNHPFIVHADNMNVRVLGTKFNVSHYPEGESINTVLVSGSVEVFNKKNADSSTTTLLKPGFMAEWSKQDHTTVIENVNTRDYTAWVEGKIIFRNSSFLEIRKTLERHFSVKIYCNKKDLDEQLFDATFDIESLNEILVAFNKSYAIDYKIAENEVFIN